MLETANDVLDVALRLPEAERAHIVDALINSLSPVHAEPLNAEWLAEIERRSDALDADNETTVPWEDIRARTRQRLGLE